MTTINGGDIRTIVVACDAGMGSSVMLASQLRSALKPHAVRVEHHPVGAIPGSPDVVVCHSALARRARASAPAAVVVPIRVFLGDPAVAALIAAVQQKQPVVGGP
jgi:mannitol-specific phosphotransferase system IIBC component